MNKSKGPTGRRRSSGSYNKNAIRLNSSLADRRKAKKMSRTAARAEYDWLAAGSQTVQQQALRDFAQAMRNLRFQAWFPAERVFGGDPEAPGSSRPTRTAARRRGCAAPATPAPTRPARASAAAWWPAVRRPSRPRWRPPHRPHSGSIISSQSIVECGSTAMSFQILVSSQGAKIL